MDNYLDKVREKRQKAQEAEEKGKLHKELVGATKESGSTLAAVITKQSAKSRLQSSKTAPVKVENLPDLVLREDMKNVVSALEAIKDENKPEKVDFTPLSKAIESLGKKIDQLPKSMPLVTIPDTVKVNNLTEVKNAVDSLRKTVESKDYKPVFKTDVKPTPVSVEIPVIDTTGIEQAIKDSQEKEEEIKLSDFRAVDMDDVAPSVQYAGLIHPMGYWEIIENNREDNTLRYKFGYGDYQEAWKNRVGHKYQLLDGAYRELNT